MKAVTLLRLLTMSFRSDERADVQVLPCTCGTMPIQETRPVMLGKIQDGGYTIILGRYKCPDCGKAPGWGRCYSTHGGWNENAEVWNRFIGGD